MMQTTNTLKSLIATKLLMINPNMDPVHGFCYLVLTTYVSGSIELNLKATISCERCDEDCAHCSEFYSAYGKDACCHSNQRYITMEEAMRMIDICAACGYTILVCDA